MGRAGHEETRGGTMEPWEERAGSTEDSESMEGGNGRHDREGLQERERTGVWRGVFLTVHGTEEGEVEFVSIVLLVSGKMVGIGPPRIEEVHRAEGLMGSGVLLPEGAVQLTAEALPGGLALLAELTRVASAEEKGPEERGVEQGLEDTVHEAGVPEVAQAAQADGEPGRRGHNHSALHEECAEEPRVSQEGPLQGRGPLILSLARWLHAGTRRSVWTRILLRGCNRQSFLAGQNSAPLAAGTTVFWIS